MAGSSPREGIVVLVLGVLPAVAGGIAAEVLYPVGLQTFVVLEPVALVGLDFVEAVADLVHLGLPVGRVSEMPLAHGMVAGLVGLGRRTVAAPLPLVNPGQDST